MDSPGRGIKSGEQDVRIVKALKMQLNRALALQGRNAIRLDPDNPSFGPQMKQAVQMFQARPLKTDGEVDAITWAALFGDDSVAGGQIATIEGNTEASKTREGGGVYRLTRKLADVNKGFIDYAGL